jgi:hypothetical protein
MFAGIARTSGIDGYLNGAPHGWFHNGRTMRHAGAMTRAPIENADVHGHVGCVNVRDGTLMLGAVPRGSGRSSSCTPWLDRR